MRPPEEEEGDRREEDKEKRDAGKKCLQRKVTKEKNFRFITKIIRKQQENIRKKT